MSTVLDNNNVVTKLKATLNAEGLSVCDADLAMFVRKNRLLKQVEALIASGHTRAEIDKAAKQVVADRLASKTYVEAHYN